MLLAKISREFKNRGISTPSIDTSRSSRDPYRSFKSQHRCQNLCSGLLCCHRYIPANFFWDISVRFLSWECWDFSRRHDHSRRSPKSSEDVRRLPMTSEVCRSLPKASSLPVLFTSKIRGREEGIAIYSFYTWFSFLTWVWVNVFLEIVSSRTATTHIFQSGVRNWRAGVSRCEIEVFNPQAWELAGIISFQDN